MTKKSASTEEKDNSNEQNQQSMWREKQTIVLLSFLISHASCAVMTMGYDRTQCSKCVNALQIKMAKHEESETQRTNQPSIRRLRHGRKAREPNHYGTRV